MKAYFGMSLVVLFGILSIGMGKEIGVTAPEGIEIEDTKESAILGPMELRQPTLYTGFPTVTKQFVWNREQAERVSELCKAWRKTKEHELATQSFAPIFSECRLRHRDGTMEFYYEAYIVFQPQRVSQMSAPKNDHLMVSVPPKEKDGIAQ